MSLYIGNLSSRTRKDELERVFQRFGRCSVRFKDGYGFVVYDFPPNAEKALRALQKRYICGEPLTLTWSNKQPRPFKRSSRTARSYEPQHSRDSLRGKLVKGKLGSNDQDNRMSIKRSNGIRRQHGSSDMHDKEVAYCEDNAKKNLAEERHGYRGDIVDEGGRFEPDPVDNDRWDEQFNVRPSENGGENDIEFDRYEPYQGCDRKYDDEIHQVAYAGGCSDPQSSPKGVGRDQVDEVKLKQPSESKVQLTCYRCGGFGHKMRNCPQLNTSLRKSTRFDLRHDDDINRKGRGESELGIFGSSSQERLRSSGDAVPKRQLKNDVQSHDLRKHQSLSGGSSPVGQKTDKSRKKHHERNKRTRKETRSPKRYSAKRVRRSYSSPPRSDYTASRSHSARQSSDHVKRSGSQSRSRSVSSRADSLLSESRSSSTSLYSRSKSSKYRARSSSRSPLSASLGQPLPSCSNKAQFNLKGCSDNATTPDSKAILVEQGQPVACDNSSDNAKLDNGMVAVNDENSVPHSQAEIEMEKDQLLVKGKQNCQMASASFCEVTNPNALAAEKGAVHAESFSPEKIVEMNCGNSEEMTEHVHVPIKNLDSESPVCSLSGHLTSLSSEDLCMVLKHYYGLDLQDENEKQLPADAYFGSARLWPWEVIYYRRLKKGAISVENYSRRVDQNREFGIVDRYIRSSSGWEELGPGIP